jgi:hypothetical protein
MQERHHFSAFRVVNLDWQVTSLLHKVCRKEISVLGFVIQRGVEVGTLLQVFLGVALGVGFFVADFNVGTGWQCNSGRDGGSGDDGEEIEVHG